MAERKGVVDWTPIYLLLVLAIAAVLVLTFVKPLMSKTASEASGNIGEAESIAGTALYLIRTIF